MQQQSRVTPLRGFAADEFASDYVLRSFIGVNKSGQSMN